MIDPASPIVDHRQTSRRVGPCELCGREQPLTFHHLIPRTVHRNKWFRKRFDREEMQTSGLMLCRLCHGAIHKFIPDEKELARNYRSREDLLAHPGLARHIAWVRKQKR